MLRILKIYPLFIASHNSMEKWLSFVPGEQHFASDFSVFLLFFIQFMWNHLLDLSHGFQTYGDGFSCHIQLIRELLSLSVIQQCLQFVVFKLFRWFSTFFVSHVKIATFEFFKSFKALWFTKSMLSKLRQAFDAILQQFSSNGNRKSMLSANRSFQTQNSTCSMLLQTILLYETCIVVSWKSLSDQLWPSIGKFRFHIYIPDSLGERGFVGFNIDLVLLGMLLFSC